MEVLAFSQCSILLKHKHANFGKSTAVTFIRQIINIVVLRLVDFIGQVCQALEKLQYPALCQAHCRLPTTATTEIRSSRNYPSTALSRIVIPKFVQDVISARNATSEPFRPQGANSTSSPQTPPVSFLLNSTFIVL